MKKSYCYNCHKEIGIYDDSIRIKCRHIVFGGPGEIEEKYERLFCRKCFDNIIGKENAEKLLSTYDEGDDEDE